MIEDYNLQNLSAGEEHMGVSMAYPTQEETLLIEAFLKQNYMFRHNILNEKDQYLTLNDEANGEANPSSWQTLDKRALCSIVLRARREGVCKSDPRPVIQLYVDSQETTLYDPIGDWLNGLPEWDGKNRMAELFSRIPGITAEQVYWCSIWLRSMVAHWLQMDMLHGNETVPLLIGHQGAGKTTFGIRMIPECLREYVMDHFNMGNKFDADMALTNNLFVILEEFDRFGKSQQANLKQALSRVKVNARRAYGRVQEDRPRFASFMGNTNCENPLTDASGSRRFVCIHIPSGKFIDNDTPIDYEQLYAQVLHELQDGSRYWFTNEECAEIERCNLPYRNTPDTQEMLLTLYRKPEGEEVGERILVREIAACLHERFPEFKPDQHGKSNVGMSLSQLGFKSQATKRGMAYRVVKVAS